MIVRQLDFYTDGAFSSKTEMGGWAFLIFCLATLWALL